MIIKTLNLLRIPALAVFIVLFFSSASYTQTPDSNTAPTVKTDETISFLITQNQNANDLIKKQYARILDLEAEVALERENSGSTSKSYEAAKNEIASLKVSNAALARAVAINEDTIKLLQEDRERQRQKAKRATREKWKAYAVAAGVIVLKLLL